MESQAIQQGGNGTRVQMPQLTFKAIVLGVILSIVLAAANAYLGLFAGMTVSASIPAAVVSMGLLRLFARSNILENNIVQTAASAGESLAAGVIFTLPALIMLGYWDVFDYWWVSALAGLGGLMGVLFTVPLRRSLIVEQPLAFPEGSATAEVLKVGHRRTSGLRTLVIAGLTGLVIKTLETGLRLWPGTAQSASWVGGNGIAYLGLNLSPALLSVGYIVGPNIASLVFAGGALAWFVAIPTYAIFFAAADPELAGIREMSAVDAAFTIWSTRIRYMGVGAMLVGGLWTLISMRSALLSGITGGLRNVRFSPDSSVTEQDTPMALVLIGVLVALLPVFLLYQQVLHEAGLAAVMTLVMALAGFLFASVAAYMAGLVGSSNNPISGITIATILLSALLLFWMAGPLSVGPAAAILVGAVVCCAAAIAGDNMQDLKAGRLVGATPWKQQLMQAVGVVSATFFLAPILNLLLNAYGIGTPTPDHPNPLLAPQATLMASVASGVFGGDLPWNMITVGVGLGMVIIALDEHLRRRGTAFRVPVLAVAVGVYLPLELSVPILGGGLISAWVARRAGLGEQGTLCAAGLITGEALAGVSLAVPIILSGSSEVLAVPESWQPGVPAGLLVFTWVVFFLARTAARKDSL